MQPHQANQQVVRYAYDELRGELHSARLTMFFNRVRTGLATGAHVTTFVHEAGDSTGSAPVQWALHQAVHQVA